MAIVFPRELPNVPYADCSFVNDDGVKASASGGRLINYTQVSDPSWEASLVTKALSYAQFSEVEAWWLSLRGGLRRVLFRHPHALFPRKHYRNQAPPNDSGNLVSVASGNVLSVNSVDAGLLLSLGDFVGLERASRYHIGRITEVSGSGVSRTITIDPPPFSIVAQAGAIVRFARPALVMRPVPGSWSVRQSNGLYTVSFRLQEAT